tara:strand:- start:4827 stop:5528 length:702 start_codon:yes stop_codon:yes gene_type:complete
MRLLGLILCAALVASACNSNKSEKVEISDKTRPIDKSAYSLGVQYGKGLQQLDFDQTSLEHLITGMRDYLKGEPQINNNDVQVYAKEIDKLITKKRGEVAKAEKEKGKAYVEKLMAEDSEYKVSPSGLVYKILEQGSVVKNISNDAQIEVHYDSFHIDDKQYESTANGNARLLPYKGIFPAWQEAFQLAGTNGEIIIIAPSDLTYGDNGARPYILPGEHLKFKMKFFNYQKSK